MGKIFVANWKMNKTVTEAKIFMKEFLPMVKDSKNEIIICANGVCLQTLQSFAQGTNVLVAGQNIYPKDTGAFTGEISLPMLEDLNIKTVMLGHSERRIYFGETDEFINEKIQASLQKGFKVVFCIGEKEEERNSGETVKVLERQLKVGLNGILGEDIRNVYVAYEPIWSISTFSTGRTATNEEIVEVMSQVKEILKNLYPSYYENIKTLYGGSVSPKNASEIMSLKNIDGALIGGASLKPESLAEVAR